MSASRKFKHRRVVKNVCDTARDKGSSSGPSGSITFNYVDITTKGCEGWLNLFFGDEIVAMVRNKALASEIRKVTPPRQ